MKKLLLLLTISLSFVGVTEAQKKGNTVTEIQTASPIFYFIYEKFDEQGNELGTVELQIHDRQRQFVSMGYNRLSDKAKGDDPKNPLIKLIQLPDVGLLAFRQAESLEELDLPVDNKTVIVVRLNKLREAARIVY